MTAAVFPGQGSQRPGMGRELVENYAEARNVFDQVSSAIDLDVARLCWESSEAELQRTENAQVALFATSMAAWQVLCHRLSPAPTAVAGHSVGEYAALVAAGVFTLDEGAKLVQARGRIMGKAGETAPGTMAAVLGLERPLLEEACGEAGGIVVVANDNCPGQLVISGERPAVEAAGQIALAKGAKRVLPLNVSGAFHSPLLAKAAIEMGDLARQSNPKTPGRAVYANVTGESEDDAANWPGLMERQLASTVQWTATVRNMVRDGYTTFIECGAGEVLSGLIRRTDSSTIQRKLGDVAGLQALLQAEADSTVGSNI